MLKAFNGLHQVIRNSTRRPACTTGRAAQKLSTLDLRCLQMSLVLWWQQLNNCTLSKMFHATMAQKSIDTISSGLLENQNIKLKLRTVVSCISFCSQFISGFSIAYFDCTWICLCWKVKFEPQAAPPGTCRGSTRKTRGSAAWSSPMTSW